MLMKHVYLLICLILLAGSAHAGSGTVHADTRQSDAPAAGGAIRFYQQFLSGADGHRCPMTPSCSSYALQAIERHGIIKGWIMSCDRLMRCGRDELERGPMVNTRDGVRCKDPVANNDFWWQR